MMFVYIFLQGLVYPIKLIFIDLLYIYKWTISPMLPHTCRFYPSCSNYMLLSIRQWGVIKGAWLGIKRICRCRPNGKTGYDFVPLNIRGELKWIY